MYHLAGEYECKIDAKGRIKIPAGLLKQLGALSLNFTINRGFENHLMMYQEQVWTEKTKEIDQLLNIYLEEDRKVLRYFYRGATKVEADGSGRILVPKNLIDYAGLEKQIVLSAYQNQIEIWAKNRYEEMIAEEPENFSAIAQKAFSRGLNKNND